MTNTMPIDTRTDVQQLIVKSQTLINWMDGKIHGLEISSDFRFLAAGGCLDLAMEYQKAIVLLVSDCLYGAAFCLMRPIYESYVRGIWLHKCATPQELSNYSKDKVPHFSELLRSVETLDSHKDGILSKAKQNGWISMNSFVHAGYQQVVHRQTESSIEPNYDDSQIKQLINFANAFSCLSAIAICDLSDDVDIAYEILERCSDYI